MDTDTDTDTDTDVTTAVMAPPAPTPEAPTVSPPNPNHDLMKSLLTRLSKSLNNRKCYYAPTLGDDPVTGDVYASWSTVFCFLSSGSGKPMWSLTFQPSITPAEIPDMNRVQKMLMDHFIACNANHGLSSCQ